MLRQAIRFALVGVVNTGTYYLLYLGLRHVVPYLVAHITAFILSMIGSFFMNTYFTYKVKPTWKKFLLFPLTNVTNFVITTVGVYALVSWVSMDERIAPLVAAAAAIPVTFVVSRKVMIPGTEPQPRVSESRSTPVS
ncbi:GtrA family protein [Embleya scabrispora]|jgi:putative flippase GtrA|uniref:GtrA family protein n=1 Tax=Embleya scabrispora TaxID=159449 RepID=UPI0003688A64|nr:GtrA family protein [Embleya scabrispora]